MITFQYARNWGEAIPRCGADLIGYFAPHEGSTTLAYGVYSIEVARGLRGVQGSAGGGPSRKRKL